MEIADFELVSEFRQTGLAFSVKNPQIITQNVFILATMLQLDSF